MALVQARGTGNGLGGTRPRALPRHSIVVIQKGHRFQRLPALSWPTNALQQWAEHGGRARIESRPHPCLARNACYAIDRLHIPLSALFVKSEQRRGLQGKQSKRRHEGIGSGDRCIKRARRWKRSEAASEQAQERIGRQMLASFGSDNRHGIPRHGDLQPFLCGRHCRIDVYEKATGRVRSLLGFVTLRELLLT
jgi:hypothetical protein